MRKVVPFLLTILSLPVTAQLSESLEVRVLELEATVLDRDGRPVDGLRRDDFQVRIGRVDVPVTNFFAVRNGTIVMDRVVDEPAAAPERVGQAQPMPTSVLIFVDELHLTAASRRKALSALAAYVREQFRPNTTATLVRYSRHFDVRVRPTRDRAALLAEIESLRRESFVDDADRDQEHMRHLIDGVFFDQREAPDVAGESPDTIFTRLETFAEQKTADLERTIDALEQAIDLASAFGGRKVLLYVADGIPQQPALELFEYFDRAASMGPNHVWRQEAARTDRARAMRFDRSQSFRRLAESAQRADVAFYSFDPAGVRSAEGRGVEVRNIRVRYDQVSINANQRGGLQFLAAETGGMYIANENDIGKVLSRLSEQFSTYYSLGVRPHPGEIEVTVRNRPDLRVRTMKRLPPRTRGDELDQNVRTRLYTLATENPHQVKVQVGRPIRMDGRCEVPVRLEVPAPDYPLELRPKELEVRMVLVSDRNDESPLQRFTAPFGEKGVSYPMVLRVRPEKNTLSVAVSNPQSGETSYVQMTVDGSRCAG